MNSIFEKLNKNIIEHIYTLGIILIILTGIVLRIFLYIKNMPLLMEEINLGASFLNNDASLLYPPKDCGAKIPFLFGLHFLISNFLFGMKTFVLKLTPLMFGILTIFAAYFFFKETLKTKRAILFALFLTACNINLIYHSQALNTYSSDVFIFLLLFLSYKYIDLDNLTKKRIIIYCLTALLLILYSTTSIFVILAILLLKLLEKKEELLQKFIVTASIIFTLFCILVIFDVKIFIDIYGSVYTIILSTGNLLSEYDGIASNIVNNNYYSSIYAILICVGFLMLIFEKNKNCLLLTFIIFLLFLSNIFRISAITESMTICLIPLFILLMVKPFDLFVKNSEDKEYELTSFVLSLLLMFSLSYSLVNYSIFVNYDKFAESINLEKSEFIRNGAIDWINNYNENELILADETMRNIVQYYNAANNKHKLNLEVLYGTDDGKIPADIVEKFLNSTNETKWLMFSDTNFSDSKEDLENFLKDNNKKYDIFSEEEFMKVFKIYPD